MNSDVSWKEPGLSIFRWSFFLYPLDIEIDPIYLFFACAERSRSIRITSPNVSSRSSTST